MVFKHLWNCFHLKILQVDSHNCFNFVLISHKVIHIELHVFGATRLLTLTKSLGGVHPIVIVKTLYWFMNYTLCLQFQDAFTTHLSTHQFGIITKSGCETIIHGIRCTLDLHLTRCSPTQHNKCLNSMFRRIIFQELCATNSNIIQLIPFVHAFYAFESSFYHNHNCKDDVMVIP